MKNENIASKRSKLDFDGPRIKISQEEAIKVCTKILQQCGCHDEIAEIVSYHLTDSNLSGVESHGIMRVLQYAEQFTSGYMNPKGKASVIAIDDVFNAIDGGGSIGIPAMQLAYETALEETRQKGITCLPIRNVGHTGRHGAFAGAQQRGGVTERFGESGRIDDSVAEPRRICCLTRRALHQ